MQDIVHSVACCTGYLAVPETKGLQNLVRQLGWNGVEE